MIRQAVKRRPKTAIVNKKTAKRERAAQQKVEIPEGSAPLQNAHHERFCLLMAEGRFSQMSCYAQCYPESGMEAARRSASELMTKPDIRARIDWLKKEAARTFAVDKAEVMKFLWNIVHTPIGYIDEESPLAQELIRKTLGGAQGQLKRGDADSGNEEVSPEVLETKIKIPGKVEAAKLLASMNGWDRPAEDPMAKAADAMTEMVRMIREGKTGTKP